MKNENIPNILHVKQFKKFINAHEVLVSLKNKKKKNLKF